MLLHEEDGHVLGGHCVFYYWNKTGRMVFGVFGDAIDEFDVGVMGNHFALEIEAQPYAGHFRSEWCPYQFT